MLICPSTDKSEDANRLKFVSKFKLMQILKKISLPFTFLFMLIATFSVQAQQTDFFDNTQDFLSKYVMDGKVDYESITRNPSSLESLVNQVARYELKEDDSDYPFYLNAYNILVIRSIIDNYPIESPMDVKGFFDGKTHKVAGNRVTLNSLENDIIRPTYQDARIHFALVCGAISCPKLVNTAFTPNNYDALLTENTKNAINDSNFIRLNEGKAWVSKIFEWYMADFGESEAGILEFINQYRSKPLQQNGVEYYDYDWTLNKL